MDHDAAVDPPSALKTTMRFSSLLLLLAVVVPLQRAHAQAAPTDREYAVWSAVIDGMLAEPGVTRIVVADSTVQGDRRRAVGPFEQRSPVPRSTPPISADVLQSFARANAASWSLDRTRLHARVPLQLLSQAGRQHAPAEADDSAWMAMHDGGFPGSPGSASLSRVGFSDDGRTALVFVRLYCGGLCAWETYFLMSRSEDGRWIVSRRYTTSQS